MTQFMDNNFLLHNTTSRVLYESCAAQPIFDYHCHLDPKEIAENKQFENVTTLWLGGRGHGDHYKWRMMRAYGVEETYITGNASPYEKFLKWAETIEQLIGNPLYHWTHLELQRYFNIHEPLTKKSAPAVWEKANALLKDKSVSVKNILAQFNVYAVGTTDDPSDTLEHHAAIASGTAPIGKINTCVIPSFRPDNALHIAQSGFSAYIEKLSKASGIAIKTVDDVIDALVSRLDVFVQHGCRASDHALSYPPHILQSDEKIQATFESALSGKPVGIEDAEAYMTKVLCALANAYEKRGIAMQLHLNALRNLNARMFSLLGADTGYDACGDYAVAQKLAHLLDRMHANGALPKTILYSLNPKDYYSLATVMGCFQEAPVRGKMQLGSAWWFCDHKDGMEAQIKILANVGMLPTFIGMLTDSRSFLSYPRHEYFRRILCNVIGTWIENGEYPATEDAARIVKDISFANAKKYFDK